MKHHMIAHPPPPHTQRHDRRHKQAGPSFARQDRDDRQSIAHVVPHTRARDRRHARTHARTKLSVKAYLARAGCANIFIPLVRDAQKYFLGYTGMHGKFQGINASPGVQVGPEDIMDFGDIWFIAWAVTVGIRTTQKGWDTVGYTGNKFGIQWDTRKKGLGCTRYRKTIFGLHTH